jgi:HK97 family phage prohead protease
MPEKKKRFVLSDESVNSYGFRVKTSGGNLERFKKNPVMLHMHDHNQLIGRWINLTVDNGIITAEPEFDLEDEAAAKISGKVERGFLNGASIGLGVSMKNFKLGADGIPVAEEWELREASICAIPSNGNAIKLTDLDTGEEITSEQLSLALSAIGDENRNPKIPTNMKKIVLSIAALQALCMQHNTEDEAVLQANIEDLAKRFNDQGEELKALKAELETTKKATATVMVENAIKEGKLTADVRESWITLAVNDAKSTAAALASMPGKDKLNVNNQNLGEIKTVDEFEKLPIEKQLQYKNDNPEGYKSLFA